MSLAEYLPPHDALAESALLGSVMNDPEIWPRVGSMIRPDDLYLSQHREVWMAMEYLAEEGLTQTPVEVLTRLKESGRLDAAGGPDAVVRHAMETASPAGAESYARSILRYSKARRCFTLGRDIVAKASEMNGDDLLAEVENRVFEISRADSAEEAGDAGDVASDLLGGLLRGDAPEEGLQTGYTAFDAVTTGLRPGLLHIIAGRPSMGKTSFVVNVATNVALRGARVAFFSLEVDRKSVVQSMVACTTGIPLQALRDGGKMSQEKHDEAQKALLPLASRNFWIYDQASLNPGRLRSLAMRQKIRHGLDLIVVDYVQLMNGGSRFGSREQEISHISRMLKIIARDLHVPVVALAQLNRGVEQRQDKRPLMSDLRESGSLEQDADLVAMLYRDWYYHRKPGTEKVAEVIVVKQRNGPTGKVTLAFDGECVKFSNPRVGDFSYGYRSSGEADQGGEPPEA